MPKTARGSDGHHGWTLWMDDCLSLSLSLNDVVVQLRPNNGLYLVKTEVFSGLVRNVRMLTESFRCGLSIKVA